MEIRKYIKERILDVIDFEKKIKSMRVNSNESFFIRIAKKIND